jgi:Mor family transcriptional regulator
MGLLDQLRHLLQIHGMAGTTILHIEQELVEWGGGQDHYLPRIAPEVRNARRTLIQAGVGPRNARYKVPVK